jgi:hypothetical protein
MCPSSCIRPNNALTTKHKDHPTCRSREKVWPLARFMRAAHHTYSTQHITKHNSSNALQQCLLNGAHDTSRDQNGEELPELRVQTCPQETHPAFKRANRTSCTSHQAHVERYVETYDWFVNGTQVGAAMCNQLVAHLQVTFTEV